MSEISIPWPTCLSWIYSATSGKQTCHSLLQKEHPTDRLWEQVFCCAEAGDKLTEYDLLICSRATCGPVASKIKLCLVTHRAPGRVTGSLLQDYGQLCGAGLGLKYMSFRVFRLWICWLFEWWMHACACQCTCVVESSYFELFGKAAALN